MFTIGTKETREEFSDALTKINELKELIDLKLWFHGDDETEGDINDALDVLNSLGGKVEDAMKIYDKERLNEFKKQYND